VSVANRGRNRRRQGDGDVRGVSGGRQEINRTGLHGGTRGASESADYRDKRDCQAEKQGSSFHWCFPPYAKDL